MSIMIAEFANSCAPRLTMQLASICELMSRTGAEEILTSCTYHFKSGEAAKRSKTSPGTPASFRAGRISGAISNSLMKFSKKYDA